MIYDLLNTVIKRNFGSKGFASPASKAALRARSKKHGYTAALSIAIFFQLISHPVWCEESWSLVFEDNFNEKQLDRDNWATRYIYKNEQLDYLNDELQRYRDNNNHVVRDGVLNLVAVKAGDNAYESGMIRSRTIFQYGYFEARVKLPVGKGIWPAFWLNSDYDKTGIPSWPPEIDIFEYVVNGKDDLPDQFFSSAIFGDRKKLSNYTYKDTNFQSKNRRYHYKEDLSLNWHTFGLLWLPTSVTVFFDGTRVYTADYLWHNKHGEHAPPAHILLNLAIGGEWAGRYGIDSSFPKALSVDYVRVCQLTSSSNPLDSNSPCTSTNISVDLSTLKSLWESQSPDEFVVQESPRK